MTSECRANEESLEEFLRGQCNEAAEEGNYIRVYLYLMSPAGGRVWRVDVRLPGTDGRR